MLLTDRCGFDEVEAIGGGRVVPATVEGLRDGLNAMLSRRSTLPHAGERLRLHVQLGYAWPAIVARLACHLELLLAEASGEGTTFTSSPPTGDDDGSAKDMD